MTVYVIQQQLHFDHDVGGLVPRFDLEPAKEYGEIKYLLSPGASPFNTEIIVKELAKRLSEFSADDYLLLVGNPILIGMASAIAAHRAGSINFLQWSGKERKYICVQAKLVVA